MPAADTKTSGITGFASTDGKGGTYSDDQDNKRVPSGRHNRVTPIPCSGLSCAGGPLQRRYGTESGLSLEGSSYGTAPTILDDEYTIYLHTIPMICGVGGSVTTCLLYWRISALRHILLNGLMMIHSFWYQ